MACAFPPDVTAGKLIFGTNVILSAGDKEFISRLYAYATTE